MNTRWVVSTETERLVLDEQRQGVTTLTVTNISAAADRARVGIVTDDTAADWFTVDEPIRLVGAGASVPFQIRVTVPREAHVGEYAVQASVTSADSAPEEDAALSNRIVVEVPAAAARVHRERPRWWWLAIPAAAVVIAAVVAAVVLLTRSGPGEPGAAPTTRGVPSTTAPAQDTVTVPDLAGLSEDDAVKATASAGLDATVKHRHDPAKAGTVTQSLPPGVQVARGSPIEVVYSVRLAAPVIVSPVPGVRVPRDATQIFGGDFPASTVDYVWTQAEPWVTFWHFEIRHDICASGNVATRTPVTVIWQTMTTRSLTMIRYVTPWQIPPNSYRSVHSCGQETWVVRAVDDFGTAGPPAQAAYNL